MPYPGGGYLYAAGQPWMKSGQSILPTAHRVEMIRLAIAGRPYFKISTIEIEHRGPSYSVDTAVKLKAQLGEASELYFIIGWDSLTQLPRWKEPARLIKMCYLVAVHRPGYPRPDIKSLETAFPVCQKKSLFWINRILISALQILEIG